MRRLGAIILVSTCGLTSAASDEAAAFSEALSRATTGAVLAEAHMLACDQHDPASAEARKDTMASWSYRMDLPGYQRVLAAARAKLSSLGPDIDQHAEKVRGAILDQVSADASICADLAQTLGEDIYDIADDVRYLLRNADDFGFELAEVEVEPPSGEVEVVPLAALSAQLAAKMDEVGSKAGARQDRALREAREAHAEAWLEARPLLAVFGRLTDDDSLREWRGDRQSAFLATCSSFADDSHEANMAREIGQDRILVGTLRWLRDDREGGRINLEKCQLFVHDPAEVTLATVEDDSAGLMLRPPEYDEAFAGPGLGIAMSDVERVLYDATFENRMDGFGNGYTDRQEDIYVLLRDGTAYRHAWNFSFTDLDVSLSRAREPERWFSWSEKGGALTLTQSGGLDAGTEIDLSEARRLLPIPQGQKLDRTYYYLNVGMGGRRSDREYAFSPDGTVVHTRGGFVAGNFGTHHITVVGEEDEATSRYAFDGHTLLIEGPDGQERHFVAIVEGDDPGSPAELIIDGQVHWLRDDD